MGARPLAHAHAHNDYTHPRPLLDALDNGFCSVEADVFLVDGVLRVGHDRKDLTPERTLDRLYLAPLWERFRRYGHVYPDPAPVTLLVDIKADGDRVLAALDREMAPYRPMLTRFRGARPTAGAVTVVLSGDRPIDTVARQRDRWVALDGRPGDLGKGHPATLFPLVSESWFSLFKWLGGGAMSPADREALTHLVDRTHAEGKRLRFWGTPDVRAVWSVERAAGVDLINTDRYPELAAFLRESDG